MAATVTSTPLGDNRFKVKVTGDDGDVYQFDLTVWVANGKWSATLRGAIRVQSTEGRRSRKAARAWGERRALEWSLS